MENRYESYSVAATVATATVKAAMASVATATVATAAATVATARATTVTTAMVATTTATAATDSGGSGGDSDSGERVVRPVWEELVIKWFGPCGKNSLLDLKQEGLDDAH